MGQHLKSNNLCIVINVYATCNLSYKFAKWEALTNLKSSHQSMAWCFCGDFNVVRRDDERKGIKGSSSKKRRLLALIVLLERIFWWNYQV